MIKSIETLILEEPRIEFFINILRGRSLDFELDVKCIEYLSINHTTEQIFNFLPRYISIMESEQVDELQDEYFKKHEFFNCGNLR